MSMTERGKNPSSAVVRFASLIKGLVCEDPSLPGRCLAYRPSMKKGDWDPEL